MTRIAIHDFEQWRIAARELLGRQVPPIDVEWIGTDARQLTLEDPTVSLGKAKTRRSGDVIAVPREYLRVAESVACHRDPGRWALLYRLLWRITHGERQLLTVATDPDVAGLEQMHKAIRRDIHKMKAFVRFRETSADDGKTWFIAWFEPEHSIVAAAAPFFSARFANMRWSILTPHRCAHWDTHALTLSPGLEKRPATLVEPMEAIWRTYYASIFNPARLKVAAMQREMPRKYWHNLPEAPLIAGLIHASARRSDAMIAAAPSTPRRGACVLGATTDEHPAAAAGRSI